MGSLITLAIWAAVIGGALFAVDTAWGSFKDHIGAPYAEAQRAADQKIADATAADRDTWKAGKVACDASVEEFKGLTTKADAACKAIRDRSTANKATSKATIDQQAKEEATYESTSAALLQFVQSKQPLKAPPDELKDVEHYLDDALDSRVR